MSIASKIAQKIHNMSSKSPTRSEQGDDDETVVDQTEKGSSTSRGFPKTSGRNSSISAKKDNKPQKSASKVDKSELQPKDSDKDDMTCHSCQVSGHKYLAECEMCDFWYCAKCQHLKADVMKLLNACKKKVHWFL